MLSYIPRCVCSFKSKSLKIQPFASIQRNVMFVVGVRQANHVGNPQGALWGLLFIEHKF